MRCVSIPKYKGRWGKGHYRKMAQLGKHRHIAHSHLKGESGGRGTELDLGGKRMLQGSSTDKRLPPLIRVVMSSLRSERMATGMPGCWDSFGYPCWIHRETEVSVQRVARSWVQDSGWHRCPSPLHLTLTGWLAPWSLALNWYGLE